MPVQTTALLIDGMGTLVSLADPVPRLVASLRERLGAEVPTARARDGLRAEIAYYRKHMGDGTDPAALADLRRRCAAELAAAIGAPVRGADPALVTEALLDALVFEPFADARPTLARVRDAVGRTRIIVVSNWDVSLTDALQRTGLAPLLDAVVTSAAVGAAKPDPAIFDHALGLAGVAPAQAIHVGDSLAEDVAGAHAAGIRAVLLDRAGTAPGGPSVAVIRSLAQLRWPYPREP